MRGAPREETMEEKKLYRTRYDRKLLGVCGGIARYLGVDPTLVRVLVVLLALGGGVGLLTYLIVALIIPEEPV